MSCCKTGQQSYSYEYNKGISALYCIKSNGIWCSLQELRAAVAKRMHALSAAQSNVSLEEIFAEGEGAELWAWEPRLDARGVIKRMQEEQRVVLGSVKIRLDRALTILQSI